jgi:hypothetical protein
VRAIAIHEDGSRKEIIKSCIRIIELIKARQVLYETKYKKKNQMEETAKK